MNADNTPVPGASGAPDAASAPGPRSSKRAIFAWCFYDWANSPFTAIVTSFIIAAWFAGGVAADKVAGQADWAFMQGAVALAIGLMAPVFGAIADNAGPRKPWIFLLTLLMSLACAALWFAEPKTTVEGVTRAGDAALVLWAVAIATLASELALVFYNAMLPTIVSERYMGRVSGWAWGLGYFGGLSALLLMLFVFIQAETPPFGLDKATHEHIRIGGPLVAVWTMLFALPLFLMTPDIHKPGKPLGRAIGAGVRQLGHTILEVRKYKQVWRFLLARLLYIDGINTLFALGGVYAATEFGMEVEEVLMFGIILNVTAGLGAIAMAWLDDWIGAKPTILISLVGILICGTPLTLVEGKDMFFILGAVLGLFFGPVQAASRSLMARFAPPGKESEMFGLYAFSGKATAFIGPWVVGIVTTVTESQRLGMATVLPFVLIGGLILWLTVDTKRVDPDTVA